MLYTTGRLTSEMVIKCALMGMPALASRSGFTAWGVEIARQVGLTLIGRMRGRRFLCLAGRRAAGVRRRPGRGARGGAAPAPQERGRRGVIAGVILAGGRATRMGGGDKCLLPLGGPADPRARHRAARAAGRRAGAERQRRAGPLRRLRAAGAAGRRRGPSRAAGRRARRHGLGGGAGGGGDRHRRRRHARSSRADLVTGPAARPRGRRHPARHGDDARRGRRSTATRPSASGRSRCARTCARRWRRACARWWPGPSRTAAPGRSSTTGASPFFNVNTPASWRGRGRCSRRAARMRVYGVTGWKNSGKTTLVERLVGRDQRARPHGLDAEARPPRLRRGPAGQGQLPPPRRRGAAGAGRLAPGAGR